jgi:hypothetical protein
MKRRRAPMPPPPPEHAQAELTARHADEMIKLEHWQRDEVRAMESRHRVEILQLERQQVIEQLQQWKRQGRQIGPGAERAVSGGGGGFRGES